MRLTSFSKLLVTFMIVGGLFFGSRLFMGGDNSLSYELVKKIQVDLEDQGFSNVEVTGKCGWTACGTSEDDMMNKKGYSFKALSSSTERTVNGCACVHSWSKKISYEW